MVIPFTATTESDNRCRLLQSISDNDHIIDCNKWHFNRFRCLLQVMNRLLLTAIIDWLAKRSLFVFLSWCTHSWLRKRKKSGRFASTIYLSIYPSIYRFAPTIYLSTTHLCNFTIIAIIICNNDSFLGICRLRVGFPHAAKGQFHRTSSLPTPPIPPLPPLM